MTPLQTTLLKYMEENNMNTLLTVEEAKDILTHLLNTNQGVCFLSDGRFITREDWVEEIDRV